MTARLPICDSLDALRAALAASDAVVLEAPPGAGKTTVVPLELLGEAWLAGQSVLMLEPRRMAARSAANRLAQTLGERPGQTVGYRVRHEAKVSRHTRIEVVTEGILTRRLQSDPGLEGVGLLIFDEFHERSLDADLGLALALQSRELFREGPPLKILVMSATLDGDAVAGLLGGAPVVRSEGRSFPVEVFYGEKARAGEDVVRRVVSRVGQVLDNDSGSVLVFLPGQGEIRRAMESLPAREGVLVAPLHGSLSLDEQQQAIDPAPLGQRKVVLATNIAETSLTIEGINTVIDSGLCREPVYDPGTGMTRLATRRLSADSAIQRAGRAGRLGPGRCYRLWSEEQQSQLAPRRTPEIMQADLAPLALQLLRWGVDDPGELRWLDAPPQGAWRQALDLLAGFGALDGVMLSAHGERMAELPAHPRIAHLLLQGCRWGVADLACELAAYLDQGGNGRGGVDRLAGLRRPGRRQKQAADQFRRLLKPSTPTLQSPLPRERAVGLLVASAYPDRIARRRQAAGSAYQLANGRSASLDAADPLSSAPWLAVAGCGGRRGQAEDRIWSAAALEASAFDDVLSDLALTRELLHFDARAGAFVAQRQRCVGAIVLSSETLESLPAEARLDALCNYLRETGLELLPWTDELRQWRARVELLHKAIGAPWPDLSDTALLADLDWLRPYLGEVHKRADFQRLDLGAILAGLLPWPLPRQLDELAPARIEVPSGSRVRVDYLHDPPVLAVKLQEMFGCNATPAVAGGRVPLSVHLLSPARRPLQVTQDLESFWRNGYAEVRKEMRGRYPKHPWPDDPATAVPTAKTNRRLRDSS